MGNIGRFVCVALPFILTLASFITLLVACLGGVTNKSLYMFQVNTTDLSISTDSITSLITSRQVLDDVSDFVDDAVDDVDDAIDDASDFLDDATDDVDDAIDDATDSVDDVLDSDVADTIDSLLSDGTNITAIDLGLAYLYDVHLWGWCKTSEVSGESERTCTTAAFNWAATEIDSEFTDKIESASGGEIEIPDEIQDGLDVFKTVTKWTEVAYIIALVALALQLVVGAFAQCSRVISCIVFLIASISTTAVVAAASLSTAMSAVIVGTVEASAEIYGVQASFYTPFLVLVWIAAAFAIAAGFFWMFSICCCAPNRGSKKSHRESSDEKLIPSRGYHPVSQPDMHGGNGNNASYYNDTSYNGNQHANGGPRSDLAYEPYSHK